MHYDHVLVNGAIAFLCTLLGGGVEVCASICVCAPQRGNVVHCVSNHLQKGDAPAPIKYEWPLLNMNGAVRREARGGSLKNFRFALRAARGPGARGPGAR